MTPQSNKRAQKHKPKTSKKIIFYFALTLKNAAFLSILTLRQIPRTFVRGAEWGRGAFFSITYQACDLSDTGMEVFFLLRPAFPLTTESTLTLLSSFPKNCECYHHKQGKRILNCHFKNWDKIFWVSCNFLKHSCHREFFRFVLVNEVEPIYAS